MKRSGYPYPRHLGMKPFHQMLKQSSKKEEGLNASAKKGAIRKIFIQARQLWGRCSSSHSLLVPLPQRRRYLATGNVVALDEIVPGSCVFQWAGLSFLRQGLYLPHTICGSHPSASQSVPLCRALLKQAFPLKDFSKLVKVPEVLTDL